MRLNIQNNLCPCCGYQLENPPWDDNSGSYEICPSCGIQFGYDDACGGDLKNRLKYYENKRRTWLDSGPTWFSADINKPNKWDPVKQLKKIL